MNARRVLRIAISALVLASAAIAVLELGTRAFLALRGDPYDSRSVRDEIARCLDEDVEHAIRNRIAGGGSIGGERFLHPYFGWDTDDGLRRLEASLRALPETRADVKVLIVGGAVAESLGRDAQAIARLEDVMRADERLAGKRIAIWSAGREGFKGPQPVNVLSFAIELGWTPDVVLNIDGADAVALGNDNAAAGISPLFPAGTYWGPIAIWGTSNRKVIDAALDVRRAQLATERWAHAVSSLRLAHSALLGDLALQRLRSLRDAFTSKTNAYEKLLSDVADRRSLRGPQLDADEHEAIEESASAWMECSRSMSGICRGRDILYVHVLHPALHDAGSKPLTAREIECARAHDERQSARARGVELGYPLLRAKGVELEKRGVAFVDASSMLASNRDDAYVDAWRLTPPALSELAERIGREIVQRWPRR